MKKAVLMGVPHHNNLGDHAIVLAEREYIENNGYNEGKLFIFIGIIVIFICIGIYGIKKEISKQIDFIDKDNY